MKSIVITGSTRGIGLAMAREFLKAECQVTLSGRREAIPAATQEALSGYEDRYLYVPCDVRNHAAVQNLWDASADHWGTIDIWINNAGQNTAHEFSFDTPPCYVEAVVETNMIGLVFGSQVAAKGMIEQKSGAIYAMEGLGSNNMIQLKTILYGMTKHALTYFTKGLARELEGTGVIAGRLSPGMMLTDFITKTPDGAQAAIETDERFKRIFNILADKPETVAAFFVPRMLANTKNDIRISWLSSSKAAIRFMTAPLRKRKLV